ncbi:MAG: glycosyltransferase family 2 protein [Candidatus Riflebacteria bacterium]|nr:glycosyltransferase family 2 protein [Candidatus Riflebacteria bacterium]
MPKPTTPRSISVVIPAYNSEESLPLLIEGLEPVLKTVAPDGFEVILVDDCSWDHTWEVIERLTGKHRWVHGIDLNRNCGQHNALLCGIREARFEVIVTMDDDLQHPPEEIPKLLLRLDEGADVVYGTPETEQHGFWRDLASQATKLALQTAMGAEVARKVSAFRAFRTALREAFARYSNAFVAIDVLLTWATTRFAAVTVRHEARRLGESNYTFRKLVTHAMNMITGFSVAPLQFASLVGFCFVLCGCAVLFFVVGRFALQGTPAPGFPFLASIIAIFSGAQLFALGVIGEYLARIHSRTMDRPPYVVRERTTPAS